MPQKRRHSRFGTCSLILIFFVCLLVILGIILPLTITARAEDIFGSPTPALRNSERIYLSAMLILKSDALTQPVNPDGQDVNLTIDMGETVASIIDKLWMAGLIQNPDVFRYFLQYTGLDTGLKAGDYVLNPAMPATDIARAMQISRSPNATFSILPGWRVEEIARSLPGTGLTISPEEFLQAAQSFPEGYSFSTCLAENAMEGFLFPGNYTESREITVDELLTRILMNFEQSISTELRNGFSDQGLDVCQATTLASIIQREAIVDQEMPMIASVFFNRLNSGSVLASDPTVQYALGYNPDQATWWTNPLTLQDLQIDSPYNTYFYSGLPPGPISNPGIEALQAVAFPAQSTYYYFRAACDGSGLHQFAITYDEHVANACP